MKKLLIPIFLLACMVGSGQKKLLITDFIFFNNFDTPLNANLENYFESNPERVDLIKEMVLAAIKDELEVSEVSFGPSAVSFLTSESEMNPTKGYKDSHKELIKEGGYDYYWLCYSYINKRSSGYDFKLESRLSNAKGKKVRNENVVNEFSIFFAPDEIATSQLLHVDDFFGLFNLVIPRALSEKRQTVQTPVLSRIGDASFKEFCDSAEKFTIQNFRSQRPVLKPKGGSGIPLRIKNGRDTDLDITEAGKGLILVGEKSGEPIFIGVRNPSAANPWTAIVNEKENELMEEMAIAPSADIFLKNGDANPKIFKLINGRLIGNIDSKSYMITYEPSASLLRVLINKKLVALSQPLRSENGPHIKLFYNGDSDELHNVVNLHQVYFQTLIALEDEN